MIALSFEGGEVSPLDLSVPDPAKVMADVHFPFSNDSGLLTRFDELNKASDQHPYLDSDCAIVVGNGAALSLVPVLPERIIFTDYSPAHLRWMNVLVEQVKETPKLHDFLGWAKGLLDNEKDDPRQDALYLEAESMNRYHHTSSQRRYANSRGKLADTEVGFVELDYSDEPAVVNFGDYLRGLNLEIRVANFTNIMSHILTGALGNGPDSVDKFVNFVMGIETLPIAPNAHIFGSSIGMLRPLKAGPTMRHYWEISSKNFDPELRNLLPSN